MIFAVHPASGLGMKGVVLSFVAEGRGGIEGPVILIITFSCKSRRHHRNLDSIDMLVINRTVTSDCHDKEGLWF